MGEDRVDERLRDLIEMMQFTEMVATKIHGVIDEAEIYRTVKEEFVRSKRHNVTIFLLTDNGSKLRFAVSSLSPEIAEKGLKVAGIQSFDDHVIDLSRSRFYRQVVREGRTVVAEFAEVLSEAFP